jgi:NAD(P)H-hydrate epimerase
MENAACGAAAIAREMIPSGANVLVLAGRGNNGGDGWAMARLLCNAGHPVEVASLGASREGSDAATNEALARAMDIEVHAQLDADLVVSADLIVDALYGTGLDRAIHGTTAEWITLLNNMAKSTILAVDLPSGLDADTGSPFGPTIRATRTATFVARKIGMALPGAEAFCGTIDVVGIGTPDSLLDRFASSARS